MEFLSLGLTLVGFLIGSLMGMFKVKHDGPVPNWFPAWFGSWGPEFSQIHPKGWTVEGG